MLVDKISRLAEEQQLWESGERLLVAVSTGVDSMVLLRIIEELQLAFGVVHVNHGLRESSKEEEDFLVVYCQERGIPLYRKTWGTPATTGIEAAARTFRYEFFEEVLAQEEYDVLLTAHHSDDQIETILMKMIREGNFFSSSGIHISQTFAKEGRLVRPLLTTTKKEILAFANKHDIQYFEDETNQSLNMQRNRLRHQVLPLLERENMQFHQHFQQWSQQSIWAQEIITQKQQAWIKEKVHNNREEITFCLADYQTLSEGERYYFLQGIATEFGIPLSEKQSQKLIELLHRGNAQWQYDLSSDWYVQTSYGKVSLKKPKKTTVTQPAAFELTSGESKFINSEEWIGLFEVGKEKIPKKVKLWSEYRQEIKLESPYKVFLRKHQPGDRISLQPNLTKKVNRYFIDKKIPHEARENAWIVMNQQEEILGLLPYVFSYLSIGKETDKILYVLLYYKRIK